MAQVQDKQLEDIVAQSNAFDQYEKAFQEVLMELDSDELMEPFRREYETLHHSFLKSHESEKRLIKKCQDLVAEILSCQNKVRTADELSAGDQSTIESLRKEIGKARNKLETSKEKEVTAKEKIKQLRIEIKDLENQVKKGVSGLIGHDSTISELAKVRDDLTKERDTQNTQLAAIRADITDYQNKLSRLAAEQNVQDNELLNLKNVIGMKGQELDEQKQRKDTWEHELKGLKGDLTAKGQEIQEKNHVIQNSMQAILRLDEQLMDQKAQTEKAIKEYEQINRKTQKYQQDLEEEIQKNSQILADNQNLNAQLKLKDTEIVQVRAENAKQTKIKDAVLKRNKALEQSKDEVEEERNGLRSGIQAMEEDIAQAQKAAENDRKQMDDLTRERDILNKNYLKAQGSTSKQSDWVLIKENQKRNLEQEIHGFELHAQKQRELIYQLQKETEAYEKDAEDASQKYSKALDAVKTQGHVVQENQKAIQDSENKLKQQQNLFEIVLNERNLYSKQLLELHSEINEMRRKFRIMNHQITQLKDEIQQKEKALVEEHIQQQKLQREKKEYQQKIKRHKTMIDTNDKKITQLSQEINKLNQIINEADAEKSKQKRDYENVMNERDILGAQLIKRNDELAQLYEKIRIQQSMLNKGELQYRDRLLDIRNLSSKISQLTMELNNVRAYISRLADLKRAINTQTKTLNQERAKVKAMYDELENPLNVHRWHKLEGSEPQTFEMIQRIHSLQKQLIAKTEDIQEKEAMIAEKEKLYVELKGILSRQPGPEVAEQLNVYKENLKKKTVQMKSMQASLAHFQSQVTQYTSEYEKVTGELNDIKKTYFKNKRQEQRMQMSGTDMMYASGGSSEPQLTEEQRALLEEQQRLQQQLANQEAIRAQQETERKARMQAQQAMAQEAQEFERLQAQQQERQVPQDFEGTVEKEKEGDAKGVDVEGTVLVKPAAEAASPITEQSPPPDVAEGEPSGGQGDVSDTPKAGDDGPPPGDDSQ
jgi:chromosome segregation ATPase|uniref:Cilia- and flagella-associated protein 58 central coiled coil domain-containing protein n=1 Tax=Eutreptiella gymnastica TaxID=73025 RepID=A0A7S4GFA4_9EUGL|mmetsp:Transcript_7580/g.14435  ORF Transcript_7580/g.14435 Transcript_7580/m.14435 type:complete len:996 (-) Transcript_7580:1936-4923(-)|eukprot:CAMPEP_0174313868 /NCGR_PEP_ID=MMETSP0810-20121108/5275_1 /TAXON_ID=73025 ORGANISM="Eutreptiella gymnastica-like, Strain CCMP1594" /NCGR_SAMPLE_ID=MMETSP0810 /ASSEMBLY_ACC=CAM_ASM_000659 /LENGTH=995 /DNA_ID=CAMNT_0015422801 /DNA_START=141 /DNA_END=3128 /DNA_ORIENTATION=-